MPRGKKFTAEQIIGKLREAEVARSNPPPYWTKFTSMPGVSLPIQMLSGHCLFFLDVRRSINRTTNRPAKYSSQMPRRSFLLTQHQGHRILSLSISIDRERTL